MLAVAVAVHWLASVRTTVYMPGVLTVGLGPEYINPFGPAQSKTPLPEAVSAAIPPGQMGFAPAMLVEGSVGAVTWTVFVAVQPLSGLRTVRV